MRIAVIDGQGGGIGKTIVERIRKEVTGSVEILALGTNAAATSNMMKAGASQGATGENAILYNVGRVDMIVGTVGILVANAMMGELSPKMAQAIGESDAYKMLLPLNRCGIEIAGVSQDSLPELIHHLVMRIKEIHGGEGIHEHSKSNDRRYESANQASI